MGEVKKKKERKRKEKKHVEEREKIKYRSQLLNKLIK